MVAQLITSSWGLCTSRTQTERYVIRRRIFFFVLSSCDEIGYMPSFFPFSQTLLSHFDAFKFPSSEVVQFRALVTPCMPKCEPVICDGGPNELRSVTSYGRRKRRSTSAAPTDDMLLVQTIQITDKFGFDKQKAKNVTEDAVFVRETDVTCVNAAGAMLAAAAFIAAQLVVLAAWTCSWQRRRAAAKAAELLPGPNAPSALCKVYDASFTRAHQRHF